MRGIQRQSEQFGVLKPRRTASRKTAEQYGVMGIGDEPIDRETFEDLVSDYFSYEDNQSTFEAFKTWYNGEGEYVISDSARSKFEELAKEYSEPYVSKRQARRKTASWENYPSPKHPGKQNYWLDEAGGIEVAYLDDGYGGPGWYPQTDGLYDQINDSGPFDTAEDAMQDVERVIGLKIAEKKATVEASGEVYCDGCGVERDGVVCDESNGVHVGDFGEDTDCPSNHYCPLHTR